MSTKEVFAGLVLVMAAFASEAAAIDPSQYANLQLGNRWVYQQSLFAGPWSVQVDSFAVRNGQNVVLLQEYDSSGFRNDQDFFATDLSFGLRHVGGLNDFGQPTQETFFYSPSSLRLAAIFDIDQVYTEVVTRTDYPGLSFQHDVAFSFDTVAVPAGTFVDALRVSERFSNPQFGTATQTIWYACGTGLVRRIADDGNDWQLTSFSGARSQCPTLAVPAPSTLLLATLGLIALSVVARTREPPHAGGARGGRP